MNRTSYSKLITIIVLAALLLSSLFVLIRFKNSDNYFEVSKSFFAFDTYCTITVYKSGAEDILEDTAEFCSRCENIFSPTKPESELYKLNNCIWTESEKALSRKEIVVSQNLYDALVLASSFSELTSYRYNAASRPITELWDFHSEYEHVLPDNNVLEQALTQVGIFGKDYEFTKTDSPLNYILILYKPVRFDLGSVAKGLISDMLKEYLRSRDIDSALINLGGNITCIGNKYLGGNKYDSFSIGIENPVNSDASYAARLSVSDSSVVTSGSHQRCFELNGVLYHHILDATTGYPVNTDLASVSIIGSSSAECDVLSTVCFILGEDASKPLLREKCYSAVFVYNNGDVSRYPEPLVK